MQRCHIHLPVTKEDGQILTFADVMLQDGSGNTITPKTYDGPGVDAQELTWPLTFAPANVDIWLDTPGRYDLHVVGPDGYSVIIPGVDFLPPPDEQVRTSVVLPVVTNVPGIGRWVALDGSILRWEDPGLIAPHDHDGVSATSTLLESVDSDDTHTLLGKGAVSGGTGATVVGALSTTVSTNGTVVGPDSDAPAGATVLGDHAGTGKASNAVVLPFGDLGADNGFVDADSVALRAGVSVETAASALGATVVIPGSPPTSPLYLRADAVVEALDARGDVVLGGASNKVGFFGSDGITQATRPVGGAGVLADLLDALVAVGLLAP